MLTSITSYMITVTNNNQKAIVPTRGDSLLLSKFSCIPPLLPITIVYSRLNFLGGTSNE